MADMVIIHGLLALAFWAGFGIGRLYQMAVEAKIERELQAGCYGKGGDHA